MNRAAVRGAAAAGVDIYPVGLLHDVRLLWLFRRRELRLRARTLRTNLSTHWRRRSYWAGWVAESRDPACCGHGWTQARAVAHLACVLRAELGGPR